MSEKSLINLEDVSPSFANGSSVVVGDSEENDSSQLGLDVHSEFDGKWADCDFLTFYVDDRETSQIGTWEGDGETSDATEGENKVVEDFGHVESGSEGGALIKTGD